MNSMSDLIQSAVAQLKNGDVVAFPTETVYGLGALITSEAGIQKIFAVKERPFFDPLIVHVDSVEMAKTCFKSWSEVAQTLTEHFWPGPLTLVMPKSSLISDLITSGLENVGVRMPNHPIALDLIKTAQTPIAAPSANKFGKTSPTKAEHVRQEFGSQVTVIDSTPCEIGIESTVLLIKDSNQLSILRPGGVTQSEIDAVLNKSQSKFSWVQVPDKKDAPGHMKHHYMPSIPFVICKKPSLKMSELAQVVKERLDQIPNEIEGIKITKPKADIKKIEFLRLPKDPKQAARVLYAALREASERKPDLLCYIQITEPESELWVSIYDRLYKAASLTIE